MGDHSAMRKLTYFVACTVDRFIAAEDGSFDAFLQQGPHLADLFSEFPETVPGHLRELVGVSAREPRVFDTVLMGRHTFEVGARLGITSPYPHLSQYLFSRTIAHAPDPAIHLVNADELSVVRRLKAAEGKGIWLCGGGVLASALFGEIDDLILKVNPVVLGNGIPLFAPSPSLSATRAHLAETRRYDNGFVLMRYHLHHS